MKPVRYVTHVEGFQLKIELEWNTYRQANDIVIFITRNGYQWSTIKLEHREEVEQLHGQLAMLLQEGKV